LKSGDALFATQGEAVMTVRERKDIPWIIAAFAVLLVVVGVGLFGGLRAGAEHFGTAAVSQSKAR
jgi:hypothetical protein